MFDVQLCNLNTQHINTIFFAFEYTEDQNNKNVANESKRIPAVVTMTTTIRIPRKSMAGKIFAR